MYQDSTALQEQQSELMTSAANQQEQIQQLIDTLQTQFEVYLPYALGLSGLILLFLLINMLQKWRVHRAILRIDRNINRLVEMQALPEANDEHEKSGKEVQNIASEEKKEKKSITVNSE